MLLGHIGNDMRDRQDEALKCALSLGVLSAFTIGAESQAEQDDLGTPCRGRQHGLTPKSLRRTKQTSLASI